MTVSIIVAASENDVIGRAGGLPWRLSKDLKRFKQLTMGHAYIVGRKTFESVGRALPGRRNIVVTRNRGWSAPDVTVATSLDDALAIARGDDEVFVGGGADIFRQALPHTERIYLTRVHATIEGDTYLPQIDWSEWQEVFREQHDADEKNQYPFSFVDYERKRGEKVSS